MMEEQRFLRRGAIVVLAAGCFLIGLTVERAGERHRRTDEAQVTPLRSEGFDLISPLLDCERAEETIGDRTLPPFQADLRQFIDRLIRNGAVSGMSVYFRDLNNGPWYGINKDEAFYPAHRLSIPFAMALMKQAEVEGNSLLGQKIRNDGTNDLNAGLVFGPQNALRRGHVYTVKELIDRMLAASDDNASSLLNDAANKMVLQQTFSDLGITFPRAESDMLSVRSMATFFRILFNASYLDKTASERLLETLSRAEFRAGIISGVPQGIFVAHTYGEQHIGPEGTLNALFDCGIVYYPDSPYLLCIMSKGISWEGNAAAIREVSRFVFDIIDAHQREEETIRGTPSSR